MESPSQRKYLDLVTSPNGKKSPMISKHNGRYNTLLKNTKKIKTLCYIIYKQTPVKTNVQTNSAISHLIQDLSKSNFNIIICLADKVSQGVPK